MASDTRRLTLRIRDFLDRDAEDLPVVCRLSAGDRATADSDGDPPVRLVTDTPVTTWTDSDGLAVFDLIPTDRLLARNTYEISFAGFPTIVFTMPDADSNLYDLIAQRTPVRNQQLPPAYGLSDGTYAVAAGNAWTTGYPIYRQATPPTGIEGTALWVDTSAARPVLKVWSGTAWEDADTAQANEVDTAHLRDGSVTHPKLAANAVEADNIAADEIGGREIAPRGIDQEGLFGDGVVGNRALADHSVGTSKLQPASVLAGFIGPEAVGTSNLQDDAVTAAKIAAGVVAGGGGPGHLAAGSVVTADLADDAVTRPKLADDAVGTAEISDGSVTEDKLAARSVSSAKLGLLAVTEETISANAVTSAKLDAAAVQRAALADRAVGDPQLGDDAVITRTIEDGAVTQDKLAASVVLPVGDGSVTTAKVADGAITPPKLDATQVAEFQRLLGIAEARGLEFGAISMTVAIDPDTAPANDEGGYSESEYGVLDNATFMLGGLSRVVRQINLDTDAGAREVTFTLSSEIIPPADVGIYFSDADQLYFLKDAARNTEGKAGDGTSDYGDPNGWEYVWTYSAGSPPFALTAGATVQVYVGGEEELKFIRLLREGLIDTAHLRDGSVTHAKLAADAVEADNIAANAVQTAAVAGGAIDLSKLAAAVAARLLPAGGTDEQVLAKSADTDYAVEWADAGSGGATGQSGSVGVITATYVQLWKRSSTVPPTSELAAGNADSPVWNGRVWVSRPSSWQIAPHLTSGNAQLFEAIATATYDQASQTWNLGTWSIVAVDSYNIRYTTSQSPDTDPALTTTSTASSSSRFFQTRGTDGSWGVWLPIYEPISWTQLARLNFNEITGTTTPIVKALPAPLNINDITLMRATVRNQTSSGTIEYIISGYWTRDGWIAGASATSGFQNYQTILVQSTQGEIHIAMTSENVRNNVSNGSTLGFDTKFALRGPAPLINDFYFYQFAAINQHGFINFEYL